MSKYKAIVFDMDGTLIDSDEVVISTWEELVKAYKDKDHQYEREYFRRFSGPSLDSSIDFMFPEYDHDFIKTQYGLRTSKYYEMYCKLFDGAKEVLTALKNDGYKLAILTTKKREKTLYCLKKYGVYDLFSLVVAAEDVVKQKPDSEGLIKIKDYFKLNSDEVLYVGDNDIDYLTASGCNVDCILMTMCKRAYKVKVNPICYINNYEDLYKEIKNGSN